MKESAKILKCVIKLPRCPKCGEIIEDYATGEEQGYCIKCDTIYTVKLEYK